MAQILLVEDENTIARLIQTNMSIPGHEVSRVSDGETALELVQEEHFDLVILDLMLGSMPGEDVLDQLVKWNIPVIVLSAKSSLSDQIQCLRRGAEDYITKPFESIDLITRAEVVLRVHSKMKVPSKVLTYKNISVKSDKHAIYLNDSLVNLTPKEYDLFLYLLEHQGNVLTRLQIVSSVWGYTFSKNNRTVDIHIQRLRKKLNLQDNLKTIFKTGYLLEADDNDKNN